MAPSGSSLSPEPAASDASSAPSASACTCLAGHVTDVSWTCPAGKRPTRRAAPLCDRDVSPRAVSHRAVSPKTSGSVARGLGWRGCAGIERHRVPPRHVVPTDRDARPPAGQFAEASRTCLVLQRAAAGPARSAPAGLASRAARLATRAEARSSRRPNRLPPPPPRATSRRGGGGGRAAPRRARLRTRLRCPPLRSGGASRTPAGRVREGSEKLPAAATSGSGRTAALPGWSAEAARSSRTQLRVE